jgi:hypothetical protein
MRATILTVALVLLGASLLGCGVGGPSERTSASAERHESYRDGDDGTVLGYGREAGAADGRAVEDLVERYYAAAASGDGATACALTEPAFAMTIAVHHEEELGSNAPAGAGALLRGATTCPTVLSRLFKRLHAELAAPVRVTGVRIEGRYGYALVGSATLPATFVAVGHETGSWQVEGLLGRPVP